ncbi:MAG: Tfp pilus assembly PilM family ATPase [Planctomycetota bacterium]|jgi:Tfp pilus assembly PilM family ATPase
MARTVTGIDIGARTAVALRGSYKGNTFHASDFAVGRNHSEEAAQGWDSLELPFKPGKSLIGVTGRDLNIRYTRVPRVPDWQLRNLMRFEVAEIGDQSGSEVASDFNLLPDIPEVEGEDIVLLAMAREQLLDSHMEGLASYGGAIDSFAPSSVALYNAFLRYGVVQDDVVLVANIGHDNVDICIVRGPDLLFARNLAGGARLFDDAIAQRFEVGPDQAEKIKIEMATLRPGAQHKSPNAERASRAILGAAGQLLSLLQSTVMFCKSQIKVSGLKVDRVLLCGGGAALDGLCEYLSAGMSMPVELFDAFRVVDTSGLSPEAADQLDEYKLESVIALGLATMGSDAEAYSLEILPERVSKKRAFWGGTIFAIAAALLAVAYLGFRAVTERQKLEDTVALSSRVSSELKRANSVHQRTEVLVDENERLATLGLELQGLAGNGEQLARSLRVLDSALPGDFWVTRLTSDWGNDEELGVARKTDRPILSLKGRSREGTDSPAVLYQQFVTQLSNELPELRMKQSLSSTGDSFTLDMTMFSPPEEGVLENDQPSGDQGL